MLWTEFRKVCQSTGKNDLESKNSYIDLMMLPSALVTETHLNIDRLVSNL